MPGTVLGTGDMINGKTDVVGITLAHYNVARTVSLVGMCLKCLHSAWYIPDT